MSDIIHHTQRSTRMTHHEKACFAYSLSHCHRYLMIGVCFIALSFQIDDLYNNMIRVLTNPFFSSSRP